MFNKLKQFKDLRDQAKTLQDELAKETITTSSGGVEITMNGNLEVSDVSVSEDLLDAGKKIKTRKSIRRCTQGCTQKDATCDGNEDERYGRHAKYPRNELNLILPYLGSILYV